MSDLFEAAGLSAPGSQGHRPLAERLRPQALGEVVGQDHLLGPDGPVQRMAQARRLSSMILWGPPGTGKTTIARLLAKAAGYEFQQISAVFTGVADLKKAFEAARVRRAGEAVAGDRRADDVEGGRDLATDRRHSPARHAVARHSCAEPERIVPGRHRKQRFGPEPGVHSGFGQRAAILPLFGSDNG